MTSAEPNGVDLLIGCAQRSLSEPFSIAPYQVLDPFQTTSTPVQTWTYTIIDYYTRSWVSAPTVTGPHYLRRNALFHDAVAERVHSCLSNEVHIYSLAAGVAAHMWFVRCNRALDQSGSAVSMEWFLQRALRGVRPYFSSLSEGDGIHPQALIDIRISAKPHTILTVITLRRPIFGFSTHSSSGLVAKTAGICIVGTFGICAQSSMPPRGRTPDFCLRSSHRSRKARSSRPNATTRHSFNCHLSQRAPLLSTS